MSTRRAVWIFIGAITLVRLALIATTNLSGDEAHYWMWSDSLAPAYFSNCSAASIIFAAVSPCCTYSSSAR